MRGLEIANAAPVERAFGHYARWIARRPRLTLLVSLAATALLTSGIGRLVFDVAPARELPARSPYVSIDRAIREAFGGSNVVALAVISAHGTIWDPEVLAVVHRLTADLLEAPGIIRQNVVSLSSPYVRVPIEREGVLTIDYLMREAPRGEGEVSALRERVLGEPLFRGMLVNDEQTATLVVADFYDDQTPADIANTIRTAADRQRTNAVQIAASGQPLWEYAEAVIADQQRHYFLASVGMILLMLYLAFGHVQGVVLPAATALSSTLCALGFMGFAGITLNAWTTAVPVVVMAIAAGHSGQMLKRYYEAYARLGNQTVALVESTQSLGPVMAAAGLMAASGFAALALLGIPTVSDFGLGVAAGILCAVGLELTFMLALRGLWPVRRVGEGPLRGLVVTLLRPLSQTLDRYPRRVALGLLALVAMAALGYPRLALESDIRTYWPERMDVGRDLRLFDRYFPRATTLTVLISGEPGSMRTPEAIRLMAGLEEAMHADAHVGWTSSLAALLMRTYQVFAPEAAMTGLPSEPDLLAQLLFLSESPMLEGYVNRPWSQAVVRALIAGYSSAATRAVLRRLEAYLHANPPRGVRVRLAGGAGPTLLAVNDETVRGKVWSLLILIGVIYAGSSVILGTPVGGAYVVAPIVMTFILTLGFLGWRGIAFDHAGATVAVIGVGLCADSSTYFLYRIREEVLRGRSLRSALREARNTSGEAVIFVALAIGGGFSVYLASDYYPLWIAGVVLPAMMLTGSVLTLTLLPLLVLVGRPRFLRPAPVASGTCERDTALPSANRQDRRRSA